MTNLRDKVARSLPAFFDPSVKEKDVADAILAKIKASVPPLVWENPCAENNWIYQAHAPWGTYGIHICGGRHQAWLEAHEKPYERWLGDGYVGSVLAAKAEANAHHVAQVTDWMEIE